ncbi:MULTISPECIES: carbohydrate ABC transporter permease [unclassified Oceanispirochaeta]|uniref:carbohydrate ABC transporter permease n=1 Tax=unclassified Oceanispirochaeta TaxID=2635722 RepID=UPI000E08D0D1|nr:MULTISPECIES: sugar ABC transporter permease [unclassified Oceanispirochaeta]MBF9014580.1 sugar ABC transporter permease [Oceanispirochaeta sp. M2]NPD70836.1 sugar ABC transporter permease [Oceanispirochaeta sp. M1]RDG34117.1 sugar ABC transporter permease [Oceanispirochaeta sp. M1]
MARDLFKNRDNKGYLFILPYFLAMLTFQLYPIFYTFYLSFLKPVSLIKNEFAGFENYARLLKNPLFYTAIGNTWFIWLMNYIPQIVFALLLAVILTNPKIKGRETFRTVYFLPNLVTAASIGVLFAVLLDWRFGALNHALIKIGIFNEPYEWLQDKMATRMAVALIQWWQWFGYTMIIFMAGLSGISDELYEAAHIDGASASQSFFKVTLPLLKPTMLYVMVTSLIGGLQIFDIPRVLTNGRGGPDNALTTIVLYLYNQGFKNFNLGYASALAYALFVMILVFSAISFKIIKTRD